ncbi:MAG: ATP phosphoribosyltransferase regulatory subunit [Lachnospiraceae bacterium]|nr:ATP phosphoribosyltransferase regulatory subunit [Lachnospiraceae bacterium]
MTDLLHTPEGVRDIYNGEYEQKLSIESSIHSVFKSAGYRDIQTPTFEYFNLFSSDIGTTPSKDLYRFTDRDGETVVLRSDFTPSIARCAAKYFMEDKDTLRFTYKGNTFSQTTELQGKLRETTQMGVDMIGDGSVEADVEVIRLAYDAIKSVSDKKFVISISHIDYFKGLSEELGLNNEAELRLRDLVTNKNFVAARQYLLNDLPKDCRLSADQIEQIMRIENLVGDVSVLNEAEQIVNNPTSKAAIDRLRRIHASLDKLGLADCIAYDLSMLNKYSYYTGVIFKAYMSGVGECIAKGGRYDNLLREFGKDAPAIGFVIVIDDLLQALRTPADDKTDNYLTFALTKGRLADKTLDLLEKIGISCEEVKDKDTRKLIFVNDELKLRFFLAKGPDVPTYVESGVADIGVVGKDTIIEENRRVYEVLDLGFGKCRMCVCGPKEAGELLHHHEKIRVCTKYPTIAKDYFYNKKHQTVELIKLNGSVELGPIVGLSDVIVDIVETGSTLRENGLDILEEICPLSARMIVNQVSMQLKSDRIRSIITKIKELI